MSISGLLKILGRHKAIVGTFAALTLAALVAVVVMWPPTYRASSAVVLLNPPAVPVASVDGPPVPDDVQNPYVSFDDLSVVVDIMARQFDSQEMKDKLAAGGLDGTFELAANRDFYRGPIIDIATEAPSKAAAVRDAKLVTTELETQLTALQKSQEIDPNYFIKTATVVNADEATTVLTPTIRMLIVVGALGAVLTVGSGLLADAISRRREKRAQAAVEGGAPESTGGSTPKPAPSSGTATTGTGTASTSGATSTTGKDAKPNGTAKPKPAQREPVSSRTGGSSGTRS